MPRFAVFVTALLLPLYALPGVYAAPAEEITGPKFLHKPASLLETIPPPPEVIEAEVIALEDRATNSGLTLLSGYRTPILNRQLPGAARRSRHWILRSASGSRAGKKTRP
ncbi:MAG: hypothetical protein A2234_07495 [Elusimicrobia bacterium RIFOXYA2_FULL_58_8]|nr:MAG: hypothetical protein A2234_07495 [Elusimicrobia bacterium RIFOXYA2_FULL_58_8]OGS13713.1 MAG: hypothetical protein A2285_01260 [Elusimicrobia bacterium RIFOXYA12_FULL_57_11]